MQHSRRAIIASLAAAPLALAGSAEARAPRITPALFSAWLDRYKEAWETRDPARAGALFTTDASYHEMPFDAPMQGRAAIEAYWARVTATQSDVHFTYDVITCRGDLAVAHWHADFKNERAPVALDGVFVCRFADARTVRALQEWWHFQAAAQP